MVTRFTIVDLCSHGSMLLVKHSPRNSIRARFAKGTIGAFAETVTLQGLTFIASVVTAR